MEGFQPSEKGLHILLYDGIPFQGEGICKKRVAPPLYSQPKLVACLFRSEQNPLIIIAVRICKKNGILFQLVIDDCLETVSSLLIRSK